MTQSGEVASAYRLSRKQDRGKKYGRKNRKSADSTGTTARMANCPPCSIAGNRSHQGRRNQLRSGFRQYDADARHRHRRNIGYGSTYPKKQRYDSTWFFNSFPCNTRCCHGWTSSNNSPFRFGGIHRTSILNCDIRCLLL